MDALSSDGASTCSKRNSEDAPPVAYNGRKTQPMKEPKRSGWTWRRFGSIALTNRTSLRTRVSLGARWSRAALMRWAALHLPGIYHPEKPHRAKGERFLEVKPS